MVEHISMYSLIIPGAAGSEIPAVDDGAAVQTAG